MSTLLICNAQIVNEGRIQKADVFIRDGRIARIDSDLSHLPSDQYIDATGLHLLPGMIDSQFSVCGDPAGPDVLARECRAAVAGGITSVLMLPDLTVNTASTRIGPAVLEPLLSNLPCNLAYYQTLKVDELERLSETGSKHCCGLFVSMASADDDYRFDDAELMRKILDESPLLVAVHAESAPLIIENEESYRQIYGDEIPFNLHSAIRSQESCAIAAEEVLLLAEKSKSKLHLMHVSSAAEVDLLEKYRSKNPNISADVCSQFLAFADSDLVKRGNLLKYNPAIKTDVDRASLIHGLLDENIDNICTGHIPVGLEEKEGSYLNVPAGLPQAQFALLAILEHYQDQILSLELIAQKTSHAIADCFEINDRGYIKEGFWADLVLINTERSFIARDEDVVSAAGWTIFNGNEFRSSIHSTIVNGQVVWSKDALINVDTVGQLIEFDRLSHPN